MTRYAAVEVNIHRRRQRLAQWRAEIADLPASAAAPIAAELDDFERELDEQSAELALAQRETNPGPLN